MSPRPLALALALVLAAAGARAQQTSAPPAPPTASAPQSPNWGPAYKEKVQAVFQRLLTASGYDDPKQLAKDKRGPTELRYVDSSRMVAGSPAVATAAHTGPNKTDHAIVIVTFGALEIGDEDHLAFFLGHEIAHLVHEHPQYIQKVQMDMFEKWYDANTDRLAGMSAEQAAAAFAREKGPELGEKTKALEREADADGLGLMATAGFDTAKAGQSMSNAQEWLAAQKLDAPDPNHDPLVVRAAQLKDYAAKMGAAKDASKRAAAVLGAPAN